MRWCYDVRYLNIFWLRILIEYVNENKLNFNNEGENRNNEYQNGGDSWKPLSRHYLK